MRHDIEWKRIVTVLENITTKMIIAWQNPHTWLETECYDCEGIHSELWIYTSSKKPISIYLLFIATEMGVIIW